MAEIIIFGGTTEGRELAEYGAGLGIRVLVSVVSDYGESLLENDPHLTVRKGAMGEAEMAELFVGEKPELVMDATHPHAVVVTEQVRRACRTAGADYVRVVREDPSEGEDAAEGEDPSSVILVHAPQEAAEVLRENDEPVLLTTGSKELEIFASAPHLEGRIFARVLPDSRVLASCEKLGISGRRLIAMQGPFSVEMNCALIESVGAGWLVTKESGSRGGYVQKLEAAKRCGIKTIVISRPKKEEGISLEAAKRMLDTMATSRMPQETEQPKSRETAVQAGAERSGKMRTLSLIGMGMGAGSQLTQEALCALKGSDAVLGARRMLEDVREWTAGKRTEALYLGAEIVRWLGDHPEYCRVAVIYSGDTGFHSGSTSLLRKMSDEMEGAGWEVTVYPGISTVSCLCARLKTSWEDLFLASAHGRSCDIAGLIESHRRVFLLLGGGETVGTLCRKLADAGYGDAKISAGIRLGYRDEQIMAGTAAELEGCETDGLAALIVERREETGDEG